MVGDDGCWSQCPFFAFFIFSVGPETESRDVRKIAFSHRELRYDTANHNTVYVALQLSKGINMIVFYKYCC